MIAPHGGRRDTRRRPWTAGGLKTNDLHTAALTGELAAATGGSAVVNVGFDRNDVDLNRVTSAHAAAPAFLEAMAEVLEAVVERHGRAVVLTVHGWNVIQPAVDLGIGYRPGRHAPLSPPGPTASPDFLGRALQALIAAFEHRGLTVAVGARYPARGRENLLQLLTTRYLDDSRPLVRRLAALGRRCDGVQLELGVPLRWPGPWRRHFMEGVLACLPTLLGAGMPGGPPPMPRPAPAAPASQTLEFVAPDLAGLVAYDAAGARLLLFENDGTLVLFTGERVGGEAPGHVGGFRLEPRADGGRQLRYEGPVMRFRDTRPFLDLEAGLAGAELTQAVCHLTFEPAHTGCAFGTAAGHVAVGAQRRAITAMAVVDHDDLRGEAAWRVALQTAPGERLLVRRARGDVGGYLCRGTHHEAVIDATHAGAVPSTAIGVRLASGEYRRVAALACHRLPVVRGGSVPPVCVEFVSYRSPDGTTPAGWGFSRLPAPPAV